MRVLILVQDPEARRRIERALSSIASSIHVAASEDDPAFSPSDYDLVIRDGHPLASSPASAARTTEEAKAELRALTEHTGAKVLRVELSKRPTESLIDEWLRQTSGGEAGGGETVHPADLPRSRAAVEHFLSDPTTPVELELRLLGRLGQWEWVRRKAVVEECFEDGSPRRVLVVQMPLTRSRRAELLLEEQASAIGKIIAGNQLEEVLLSLITAIEANYKGALAAIARLDETTGRLYHIVGPSLPSEYTQVLNGLEIGPEVGACGAAAFEGRRVIIDDLLGHPSCQPYRDLFERIGLRSVWSQPIFGAQRNVLGTFSIYHREQRSPDDEEIRLIESASQLAALAIERWRQVEQLRTSEEHYRQFAERARLIPWEYDFAGRRFTYVGPQVQEIVGYPMEVWKEPGFWMNAVHPDDLDLLLSFEAAHDSNPDHHEIQYRMKRPDGRIVWLHSVMSLVRRDGNVVAVRGFSIDITERKLIEEALRQSEERYRILADYSTDMISRLDASGTFHYVSPACRTVLGYEPDELIGRSCFELIHPDDLPTVNEQWDSIPKKGMVVATARIRKADGDYVWLETLGRYRDSTSILPFEVIATSRDITERIETARMLREREAELAHAERLSTMGQMAAELAHELNQPLQAITNFADAAIHWAEHPTDNLEPLHRWTTNISQQAGRAGQVVRRILNFVRKGELDPAPLDLTQCVRDLKPLLEVAARNMSAKIEYQLAGDLPEVEADRLLIEQVVINLFRNALESMSQQPVEQRHVVLRTFRAGDNHIGLAVQDRGRGLGEESDRLFEPYFTTKSDGTGMGLAICRSTIDAHQGRIWAENNPTGGATFRFELPIQPEDSARLLR